LHLHYPATLKGDNNPNTQGDADPLLNYPYGCCGKEVPGNCKGHLDLVGTDEGKATASWTAGQSANFSVSGHAIDTPTYNPEGGNHGGGSAQIGFSVDGGETFKVAKTWQGNWPEHGLQSLEPEDMTYEFQVPADLPEGDVIFGWTWVNRENEFNMNCAVVSITGGSSDTPDEPEEPTESATPEPTSTEPSTPEQTSEPSQFTLQGCSCACPAQTWSEGCTCYDCQSPSTKRRDVEREAVAMHKRNLQRSAFLNAPLRRAEAVAFTARPDMLLNIDFDGASCRSAGNPTELKYPEPGPDVVVAEDGEYALEEPSC
jgi:hypothetical protein